MNGQDHENEFVDTCLPVLIGALFLLIMFVVVVLFARSRGEAAAPSAHAGDYQQALYETLRPNPELVSYVLYKFDRPTTFVTWTEQRWVPFFKPKDDKDQPRAGTDIWVTDAASLQNFCKDFVRSHGADPTKLSLRLAQRLGLPPNSANDRFVELSVDPKDKGRLFRPCGDLNSRLDQATCVPLKDMPRENAVWDDKDPASKSTTAQEWILRKYYSSYASSHPFPWTALGYTFDWARAEDGTHAFVRRGQSEFVIPKGDPVHFVSSDTTSAWCNPD